MLLILQFNNIPVHLYKQDTSQVNGEEISTQTDIYSLGILFYEMLTGVKPYTTLSNTELFSLISQGKYRSARSYVNKIPRKLNRILKKMFNRSLEKRYQSVSELIFDINQFLKWENQINLKYRLSRFMSGCELPGISGNKVAARRAARYIPERIHPAFLDIYACIDVTGIHGTWLLFFVSKIFRAIFG